jgi:hypothetical protein
MDWAGGWCWLDRYELRALQAKCSHLDHRPSAGLLIAGVTGTPLQSERAICRTATRYGGAVDVKRAADLYAHGWTLRQIGAELGVSRTAVSEQLRQAGVAMRRGARAHPASTQQILELRDQGRTWSEVAKQAEMTRSGAWSRYRRARPPKSGRLGRWQRVLADALDQNLAIGVRATVADHLGRAPTRAELTAARRAAHSLAALGLARVLHVPGADADGDAGDRTYLVLAKPTPRHVERVSELARCSDPMHP